MARLLGLIVFVAALVAPASALGAVSEPEFCERTIVAAVPQSPEHEPKPDGRLGFGPASIRMRVLPRLVAPGGKVGYELYLHPRATTAHPRWRVATFLLRLQPGKRSRTFLEARERRVRTLDRDRRTSTFFEVAAEPARYAVIAIFTSLDGRRKLGRFRFHFKVIPPTLEARLALDAYSYDRGQTVFGRIENDGTAPVLYGAPYRIERFDGASWSLAPESPDAFILPQYTAPPGETGGECSPFQIPSTMPPGHYRMVKKWASADLPSAT